MKVYQVAATERLVICPLTNPDWLPQLDRLSAAFPGATVVIDHFARIGVDGFGQTPPVPGTIKPEDVANLVKLARHPARARQGLGVLRARAPHAAVRRHGAAHQELLMAVRPAALM